MLRKKVVEPLYESKPIWLIWTELGRKMGYAEHFPWNTDEEVAEHFFSTSGVTVQQLKEHPEGVYFGKKEYRQFEKRGFQLKAERRSCIPREWKNWASRVSPDTWSRSRAPLQILK